MVNYSDIYAKYSQAQSDIASNVAIAQRNAQLARQAQLDYEKQLQGPTTIPGKIALRKIIMSSPANPVIQSKNIQSLELAKKSAKEIETDAESYISGSVTDVTNLNQSLKKIQDYEQQGYAVSGDETSGYTFTKAGELPKTYVSIVDPNQLKDPQVSSLLNSSDIWYNVQQSLWSNGIYPGSTYKDGMIISLTVGSGSNQRSVTVGGKSYDEIANQLYTFFRDVYVLDSIVPYLGAKGTYEHGEGSPAYIAATGGQGANILRNILSSGYVPKPGDFQTTPGGPIINLQQYGYVTPTGSMSSEKLFNISVSNANAQIQYLKEQFKTAKLVDRQKILANIASLTIQRNNILNNRKNNYVMSYDDKNGNYSFMSADEWVASQQEKEYLKNPWSHVGETLMSGYRGFLTSPISTTQSALGGPKNYFEEVVYPSRQAGLSFAQKKDLPGFLGWTLSATPSAYILGGKALSTGLKYAPLITKGGLAIGGAYSGAQIISEGPNIYKEKGITGLADVGAGTLVQMGLMGLGSKPFEINIKKPEWMSNIKENFLKSFREGYLQKVGTYDIPTRTTGGYFYGEKPSGEGLLIGKVVHEFGKPELKYPLKSLEIAFGKIKETPTMKRFSNYLDLKKEGFVKGREYELKTREFVGGKQTGVNIERPESTLNIYGKGEVFGGKGKRTMLSKFEQERFKLGKTESSYLDEIRGIKLEERTKTFTRRGKLGGKEIVKEVVQISERSKPTEYGGMKTKYASLKFKEPEREFILQESEPGWNSFQQKHQWLKDIIRSPKFSKEVPTQKGFENAYKHFTGIAEPKIGYKGLKFRLYSVFDEVRTRVEPSKGYGELGGTRSRYGELSGADALRHFKVANEPFPVVKFSPILSLNKTKRSVYNRQPSSKSLNITIPTSISGRTPIQINKNVPIQINFQKQEQRYSQRTIQIQKQEQQQRLQFISLSESRYKKSSKTKTPSSQKNKTKEREPFLGSGSLFYGKGYRERKFHIAPTFGTSKFVFNPKGGRK
jgi:hypothetical protein